jgi:hypothetical protein
MALRDVRVLEIAAAAVEATICRRFMNQHSRVRQDDSLCAATVPVKWAAKFEAGANGPK